MERKIIHNFSEKVLVVFVATVLLVFGIFFVSMNVMETFAADTSVVLNTDGYYVKKFKATEFNTYKETQTHPKMTSEDDNNSQNWLFAGWYQDNTCEKAYSTTITSIADTSTIVYAKFVPAEIMTVKCQVTPGTDENSEKTNMRLISTTNSAEYKGVGFDVSYKGKTTSCSTSTLYKRISATDDGMESGYSPVAFNQKSEYFFSVRLTNISNASFDEAFYIQPYWITPDGTKVVGICRYARIEDSYKEIVNLPVRLYSDTKVTNGNVSLEYDTTKFELYDYDAGTVFSKVDVSDDATNGVIAISGSAATAVIADGVFANIRLQLKKGQLIESNTLFAVTNNGFANSSNNVAINVSDIIYKNYTMTYSGTPDKSWYEEFKNTEDTFVLSSVADLYGLAQLVNASTDGLAGKTFKLGADVIINKGTASESDFVMSDSAAIRYQWTPIGNANSAFEGTFDGQDNAIGGVFIDSSANYLGLFGKVGESGVIQNFELRNTYINSTHNYPLVGSIAGYCNGQINNVYSNAFINCTGNYCGGIVGRSEKGVDIIGCWFEGSITTAGANCGGILGSLEEATNAASSGNTTVKSCLSSGNITATSTGHTFVGGLVGVVKKFDSFEMVDCLSDCSIKVNTTTTVGSVVGQVNNNISAGAKFTNVFTTDDISDLNGATLSAFTNQGGEGYSLGSNSVYAIDKNYVPKIISAAELTGFASYDVALDYTDSDVNDAYWVARVDGTPVIERFAKENVIPCPETEWYSANSTSKNYTLQTVSELYGFAKLSQNNNFAGWTINLVANKKYELNTGSAEQWAEAAPKHEWVAIGRANGAVAFAGTFNGNGATISGMYIDSDTNLQGLFGRVNGGVISNIKLVNSYIATSGAWTQVGSVIGVGNGTFTGIYSDVIVKNVASANAVYTGGILGFANSNTTINDCQFAGKIETSGADTGGLVGYATGTIVIKNSRFNGKITAGLSRTGGLLGYATNGVELVGCQFDGEIVSGGVHNGGFIGIAQSATANSGVVKIENCHSAGSLISNGKDANNQGGYAGGLCGYVAQYASLTVKGCLNVSTISVKATQRVGSVMGQVASLLSNATFHDVYTTDNITNSNGDTMDFQQTGTGTNNYSLGTYSQYAINASSVPIVKTEAALTGFAAYETGLNFEDTGSDGIYWVARTNDTPVLAKFSNEESALIPSFSTDWYDAYATEKVCTLRNVEELYGFAKLSQTTNFSGWTINLVEGQEYILNEGNASEWEKNAPKYGWIAIGRANANVAFAGTFNGNSATISGIYINSNENLQGLFGRVNGGSVSNLKLINSYVASSANYTQAAGIAGLGDGTFNNVYSSAIINVPNASVAYSGGIVGRITSNTASITNSWFDGSVSSSGQSIGGIVGYVSGILTINNSLNTGSVTSTYTSATTTAKAGGLCGTVAADGGAPELHIANSLNTGVVKTVATSGGAGSVMGDAVKGVVTLTSVYATKESCMNSTVVVTVGHTGESANISGSVVQVSEDQLISIGGSETLETFDFVNIWTNRNGDVPALKVLVSDKDILDIALFDTALQLWDSNITSINTVNKGSGNYVYTDTSATKQEYEIYMAELVKTENGYVEFNATNSNSGLNGTVYNHIYTKDAFVLHVTYVENSSDEGTVYISGSYGQSISPYLKQGYGIVSDGETSEIATLHMVKLSNEKDLDGGSSFVIQLKNGHFIINDGGHRYEAESLIGYLKELAGENDIIIDAWTISHLHSDHCLLMRDFADNPGLLDGVWVEGVYINEPSTNVINTDENPVDLTYTISRVYQGVKMLRTTKGESPEVYRYQTGQRYYFDDVTMDVVLAQEQLVDITDFNETSTWLMFTIEGKKVLIAGDAGQTSMRYVQDVYGADYLKADVYTAFHHGINVYTDLIDCFAKGVSSEQILLVPQISKTYLETNYNANYNLLISSFNPNYTYWMQEGTTVLNFYNNTIECKQKASE